MLSFNMGLLHGSTQSFYVKCSQYIFVLVKSVMPPKHKILNLISIFFFLCIFIFFFYPSELIFMLLFSPACLDLCRFFFLFLISSWVCLFIILLSLGKILPIIINFIFNKPPNFSSKNLNQLKRSKKELPLPPTPNVKEQL